MLRTEPRKEAAKGTTPPRLGAFPTQGGTRFTLWSTRARRAAVRLYATPDRARETVPLEARGGGIFETVGPGLGAGALYTFVLDDDEYPDPYPRFLPHG